jgi:hypothetical protein
VFFQILLGFCDLGGAVGVSAHPELSIGRGFLGLEGFVRRSSEGSDSAIKTDLAPGIFLNGTIQLHDEKKGQGKLLLIYFLELSRDIFL